MNNSKSLSLPIAVVLSFFLICSSSAYAGSTMADSSSSHPNSLAPGKWALEFGISSNFTLTSFQGTVLSIKRQMNSHEAVELAIGGSLYSQSGTSKFTHTTGDTVDSHNSGSNGNESHSISLSACYLYYPNPDGMINLYFGAGPTVTYGHSDYRQQTYQLPVPPAISTTTITNSNGQTSWGLGASGLVGAEWFMTKYLSLHAQYGLSVMYVASHSTQLTANSSTTTSSGTVIPSQTSSNDWGYHGWQINPSSVMFGLSVYFN